MRVVFMGTPHFAVPILRALAAEHELVAAYTRPDAVSGRGLRTRPSPVKIAADELGVPVEQPATLRGSDATGRLRACEADVVVVAAYGLILPIEILEIPPLGCINVHASLLPRWRGAAPIQRAILAGDTSTGVSIMRMEEGLDTGPYCITRSIDVADKTADALTAELAEIGAQALLEALDKIRNGTCRWSAQDESLATYAEKISKLDVALSPELRLDDALRRVRASTPQAPARVSIGDRTATVLETARSDEALPPGAVACTKSALLLGFADGTASVEQLRPDGKSAMAGRDWARGARFPVETCWEPAS